MEILSEPDRQFCSRHTPMVPHWDHFCQGVSVKVSCFCGTDFESDDEIAQCPTCGQESCAPSLTYREMAEMEVDLAELLAEHERA